MRPLIEMLEDERMLMHKLDSIHRFILKVDNELDTVDMLIARKRFVEDDLEALHDEMREYIKDLLG